MADPVGKVLSAKDILSASDQKREKVDVPEWGGAVYISSLSAATRDAYEGSLVRMNGKEVEMATANARAKLLALTLVDEAGARLFTDAQIEALGGKNGEIVDRLYKVAQRLSGMTPESVKTLAKN